MVRAKQDDKQVKSYAELRQELEALVLRLQDPDCDVDQAAALYEQALELTRQLEARLETAENRIRRVQADFGVAAPGAKAGEA